MNGGYGHSACHATDKTRVLCPNGHGLQLVIDYFLTRPQPTMELECGCRRGEALGEAPLGEAE